MCMSHDMSVNEALLAEHADLHWHENGQAILKGKMLANWQMLDDTFREWGGEHDAEEIMFPSFIAVEQLQKMDYLQSFPHLVTFAVNIRQDEDALLRFSKAPVDEQANSAVLHEVEPVKEVLTPAACYHAYIYLENASLKSPCVISTRNTCYRKERYYAPLQRQWAFSMRELVCLGDETEVDQFLRHYQQKISAFAQHVGIEAHWQTATDPFFLPEQNEKYLAQRLLPIKQELVLENGLAIASLNRHSQHFGEHFDISYKGEAAFSGCVAFGLERWLYALSQVKQ